MKLENRTILITGGTSGMGLELARQLLERRNVVIITGRDREKLDRAKRELPSVQIISSDAADASAIAALYEQVTTRFPALDTVINNAGVMRVQKFNQQQGLENLTREIDVCLSGPILMAKQFLPHLRMKKDALLINVSSGAALIPFPISPVYSAAKAGIHSFTASLRVQMEHTGVKVVELIPPGVETPLFRNEEFEKEMKVPKGMDVTVYARKAIAGIEAGKKEVRPGLANVLKVMSRLAPGLMLKQMARMTPAFSAKSGK